MKRILTLLGVLAALSAYGCRFDTMQSGMVEYCRIRAKARGQDIVRELIGRVKLLCVSRRILSTPGCCNAAKAVVARNLRNFHVDDTLQKKCDRTSSLCVSTWAHLRASREIRREVSFFRSDC